MMTSAGKCATCQAEVWLPYELHAAAKHSCEVKFYCGYGHELHFPQGESVAEKLRRERDRLAQRVAERDDEIAHQRQLREETERRLAATRGIVTRIKNRVGRGVCPCCNRTFSDVARHMASKHPDYHAAAEAAE